MSPEHSLHPLHGPLARIVTELGMEPAAVPLDQLLAYMDLLQRWNATYNLTAVRDPQQMLIQHLADCLAVVGPMKSLQLGQDSAVHGQVCPSLRVLDVGSGGGLPGVVLASMFPGWRVVCVDTVGKKAAFIRQAAAELGLGNLRAEHARVEALHAAPFDVITSRAFSSLLDFTRLTQKLLAPGGVWMAMKGKVPADEISALPDEIEVFHVEPLVVPGLSAERCLVWMRPRPASSASSLNSH